MVKKNVPEALISNHKIMTKQINYNKNDCKEFIIHPRIFKSERALLVTPSPGYLKQPRLRDVPSQKNKNLTLLKRDKVVGSLNAQ